MTFQIIRGDFRIYKKVSPRTACFWDGACEDMAVSTSGVSGKARGGFWEVTWFTKGINA